MWRFFQWDALLPNLSKIKEHHLWNVTDFLQRCNYYKIQGAMCEIVESIKHWKV